MNLTMMKSAVGTVARFEGPWDINKALTFFQHPQHLHTAAASPRDDDESHGEESPLVVDLDGLTSFPTPEELMFFVGQVVRSGQAPNRFALLACKPVTFGLGRMASTLAIANGWELPVFRRRRDAELHLQRTQTTASLNAELDADAVDVLRRA